MCRAVPVASPVPVAGISPVQPWGFDVSKCSRPVTAPENGTSTAFMANDDGAVTPAGAFSPGAACWHPASNGMHAAAIFVARALRPAAA